MLRGMARVYRATPRVCLAVFATDKSAHGQVYENCVGCCMNPENEAERAAAMSAARTKKTFQKAVAANDAFEFCRSFVLCLLHESWLPGTKRAIAHSFITLASSLLKPACAPSQGQLPDVKYEHSAWQCVHQREAALPVSGANGHRQDACRRGNSSRRTGRIV